MVSWCDLLLPRQHVLAKDLGGRAELLPSLGQETSSEDDGVRAHDSLVVVDVGSALVQD